MIVLALHLLKMAAGVSFSILYCISALLLISITINCHNDLSVCRCKSKYVCWTNLNTETDKRIHNLFTYKGGKWFVTENKAKDVILEEMCL